MRTMHTHIAKKPSAQANSQVHLHMHNTHVQDPQKEEATAGKGIPPFARNLVNFIL